MQAERRMRRADGSHVKLVVSLSTSYNSDVRWSLQVFTKEKGRRKWNSVNSQHDWEFRKLRSLEARQAYLRDRAFDFVSAEEVLAVVDELLCDLRLSAATEFERDPEEVNSE
jgi:hypothetical protein